ncbi:hypothetical protein DR64_7538 [Paraburkholderia xenovorans LB400]|uniref:SnoaL-like domain-containing protein n=1 Tax=Paraburkholderia xenovorans (strain LB400) TaxID=266265 RepID=Q13GK3_PARXL|nr:nuclear transport factor 2 family protein [Paraburkholderia xenovorans]ABE36786.1 hypothetical protein Bxe_C0911 [Paraburkholderia xenovorans LB400]AIP34729.1 hypothetical protein DR64_7538 [Paraburkholderia xenovorans LB400]
MEHTSIERDDVLRRLRQVEDHLNILNLIAAHPPCVDTGSAEYAENMSEDTVLDRGVGLSGAFGRVAFATGITGPAHREAIQSGISHFLSLPYISVSDDTAVAIGYLQILIPAPDAPLVAVPAHGESAGFKVFRVTANRWDLERRGDHWEIKRRSLRLLDDTDAARKLLREAIEDGHIR